LNVESYIAIRIPINYLILGSGVQHLSVTVLPILGKTALDENVDFSMTLQLYEDTGKSLDIVEDILEYRIPEDTNKLYLPIVEHQTTFNASVPYKLNVWQNSVDLSGYQNIRNLIDYIYKKIEFFMDTKRYNEFIAMMKEREDNMCISLYISPEESQGRMQRLVDDFNNGFKMVPFSPADVVILYYAQGKVIKLVKKDLKPAFRFANDKTEEEMGLEILFHLKQGSKDLSII
jgi:hypothetical protein